MEPDFSELIQELTELSSDAGLPASVRAKLTSLITILKDVKQPCDMRLNLVQEKLIDMSEDKGVVDWVKPDILRLISFVELVLCNN
jgi:uncharacterized protein (UPF0147 family)